MNTIKFDITFNNQKDFDFVINKQRQYSYAFKSLYCNFNKVSDKEFTGKLRTKFKLSVYELNCLIVEVKAKFDAVTAIKANTEQRIVDLEQDIISLNEVKDRTKCITRKLFKLKNKLEYHKSRLSKDITFGTLETLRRLSFLNNDKKNNVDEILKVKEEYKSKRLLSVYYVGSLNDPNSNRHFSFDFDNNKLIYKPYCGRKIEINFVISNNKKKDLIRLQKIKDSKFIPLTVRLSHNYVTISFDEEKLNGYGFDERSYKNELSKIDKSDKETRKAIANKYKIEQDERKLENKNRLRYCSIDLNPEYIGVSIFDKINDDGELKLIEVFTYDLTLLMGKSNKANTDKLTKYITNKCKFEIGNIYKHLFNKVKHYKCAYFVIEELNFKTDNKNTASKEANRKVKNIWNRTYQYNLITKHCNINGIKLIEVNPCYSSFIGNMMYQYFDPSNSAIEIGRRGIVKYVKGNFYPKLTASIIDTGLNRLGLTDVQFLKTLTWVNFFNTIKETKVKYRFNLVDVSQYSSFSKSVNKTKWRIYSFV